MICTSCRSLLVGPNEEVTEEKRFSYNAQDYNEQRDAVLCVSFLRTIYETSLKTLTSIALFGSGSHTFLAFIILRNPWKFS
jgi:hypothetical protein